MKNILKKIVGSAFAALLLAAVVGSSASRVTWGTEGVTSWCVVTNGTYQIDGRVAGGNSADFSILQGYEQAIAAGNFFLMPSFTQTGNIFRFSTTLTCRRRARLSRRAISRPTRVRWRNLNSTGEISCCTESPRPSDAEIIVK